MNLADQISASDQSLKVQAAWDDRVEKFTRLEMEIQSHAMEMIQKEIANRVDFERLQALRHARLTLQRETKKLSIAILRAEKKVARIESDLYRMHRLLVPASISESRIVHHWVSLSRYIEKSRLIFAESGGHVFKKSISMPMFEFQTDQMSAAEFVAYCRFNAMLVKTGNKTQATLRLLIDEAVAEANMRIESFVKKIGSRTIALHEILNAHWKQQEV